MKTLNGKDAIQFGFKAVTSNFLFFLGIVAIIFVADFLIPQMLFGDMSQERNLFARLIVWLISTYAALGLVSIGLRTVDKKPLSYQDFFKVSHVFIPYVIATVIVQIATGVGIILLVVPGIMIALMWLFYAYLILDKNLQPLDALKASAAMTKGYRWPLFGIALVLILINVAGAIIFGLGLILTVPVTAVAMAHLYRQLA